MSKSGLCNNAKHPKSLIFKHWHIECFLYLQLIVEIATATEIHKPVNNTVIMSFIFNI